MIAASVVGVSAQESIKCISDTNPLTPSLQYFPPTMRITGDGGKTGEADVTVAGGFSVHYDNYFKLVKTICGPHQPTGCQPQTYILTLCGADKPTKYANGTALPSDATHFTVPLTGVGIAKGGPVPFLELLGQLNKVQVVDHNNIHSPCLQALEQSGNITGQKAGGAHKTNFTKLIKDHPTVTGVFTDSWRTGESNTMKDIVFDGSADSAGILGRAEWIKFMSLFFNDEDKANQYFANEQKAYKEMEDKVKTVKTGSSKTCAWVQKTWTGKYEVSFTTYKTDLCKSAGLVPYVNATLVAAKTFKQVFATTADFHDFLHKQDVVIDETYQYNPTTATKAVILASMNVTGLNKSGAMLLRTDAHLSDAKSKFHGDSGTGTALDWYESAIARPALVLQDFATMVYGADKIAAPPAGCSQYFRNVLADEMPVVNTHESCAAFGAAEKEGKCITNAVNDRPPLPPPPMSGASPASAAIMSMLLSVFAVMAIF